MAEERGDEHRFIVGFSDHSQIQSQFVAPAGISFYRDLRRMLNLLYAEMPRTIQPNFQWELLHTPGHLNCDALHIRIGRRGFLIDEYSETVKLAWSEFFTDFKLRSEFQDCGGNRRCSMKLFWFPSGFVGRRAGGRSGTIVRCF